MSIETSDPDEPPITPPESAAPAQAAAPAPNSAPEESPPRAPGTTTEVGSPLPAEPLRSTRASRAWVKILPAVVVLAVILDFVFQNLHGTKVRFITLSGTVPLALALLIAAALGALLVLALGSIRIVQLRKVIHTYRRAASDRTGPRPGGG